MKLLYVLLILPLFAFAAPNPANIPTDTANITSLEAKIASETAILPTLQANFDTAQANYTATNTANLTAYKAYVTAAAAYNAGKISYQAAIATYNSWVNASKELQKAVTALNTAKTALKTLQDGITADNIALVTAKDLLLYDNGTVVDDSSTDANGNYLVKLLIYHTNGTSVAMLVDQVRIANEAHKNSFSNVRYEVNCIKQVKYSETNPNAVALQDMTNGIGGFANVQQDMKDCGADNVVFVRNEQTTQLSCGTSDFGVLGNKNLIFATVGYGVALDNPHWFCSANAFTHELGHLLGLNHDVANSPGASTCLGTGENGKYGTIMSYMLPVVMYFSTPLLTTQCAGGACGVAPSADQVKCIADFASFATNIRTRRLAQLPTFN